MFKYVFDEYERNVFTPKPKTCKLMSFGNKFVVFLAIIFTIAYAVAMFIDELAAAVVFALISLGLIVAIYAMDKKVDKKREAPYSLEFLQSEYDGIVGILKRFDCLSKSKVKWFIRCCDEEIKKLNASNENGNFALTYVFPLVTSFLGMAITGQDGVVRAGEIFIASCGILILICAINRIVRAINGIVHFNRLCALSQFRDQLELIAAESSDLSVVKGE